jgi:hypothetical protein
VTTVGDVREALAAAVSAGVPSLRTSARYPGTVTPPAAIVRRLRVHPGVQFNGGHTGTFAVSVYLPAADAASSVDALDDLLDPDGPIYAAVLADSTLGGVVRSVVPAPDADVEEEALVTLGGLEVLAGTIPFEIVFE